MRTNSTTTRTERTRIIRTMRLLSGVGAFLMMAGGGCGDDESTGPEEMTLGTLIVHLTDAPFPFEMIDSAMVTVDSLRIHYASGDSAEAFMTVDREPRRVNLLDLTNGTTEILASAEIPAGTVNQMRLHVNDASVTLSDGRSFGFQVPSGSQSGIKIFPDVPIDMAGGVTTELVIDFDVSESFKPVPDSPERPEDIRNFQFHPVLRVQILSESGSLSGTVWTNAGTPDPSDDVILQRASVTARFEGRDVSTTASAEDGQYRLMGLLPGRYVLIAAAAGFLADSLEATVAAGSDAGGNDFRLEASTVVR